MTRLTTPSFTHGNFADDGKIEAGEDIRRLVKILGVEEIEKTVKKPDVWPIGPTLAQLEEKVWRRTFSGKKLDVGLF